MNPVKEKEKNQLMCDPETGVCELPDTQYTSVSVDTSAAQKPVRIIYFTDPICSTCWGIEPELRKLKLEYGDYFDIEYRMGGLLRGWDSYGGKDVRNPTEVAHHWDEVSAHYDMPIDGNVWLEDPLDSSYPPSVAFKAAQIQDEVKALKFLRRIREMVFLEKKNITRWEHLEVAALEAGIDPLKLKTDFEGQGKHLFEADLNLRAQLNVRGFPTLFFTDADDNRIKVYGYKSYNEFEQALLRLCPKAIRKDIALSAADLFSIYPTLTTKEFGTLTNRNREEAEVVLHSLVAENKVRKHDSRSGPLWFVFKQ